MGEPVTLEEIDEDDEAVSDEAEDPEGLLLADEETVSVTEGEADAEELGVPEAEADDDADDVDVSVDDADIEDDELVVALAEELADCVGEALAVALDDELDDCVDDADEEEDCVSGADAVALGDAVSVVTAVVVTVTVGRAVEDDDELVCIDREDRGESEVEAVLEVDLVSSTDGDSDTALLTLEDELDEADAEMENSLENDVEIEPLLVGELDTDTVCEVDVQAESEIDGSGVSDTIALALAV